MGRPQEAKGGRVRVRLQSIIDAFSAGAKVPFEVRLPDGERIRSSGGEPSFTLIFKTRGAVLNTIARGHIGLLESFFDQTVDLLGDFNAAVAAGMGGRLEGGFNPFNRVENWLHEARFSNRSLAQAKANARAHYGLGEPFYRLWLDDPYKMYTCGYWKEGTRTIEQAQQAKIDHVCRKIKLSANDRYVDIGSGFGGFMFRAWEQIGATGVGLNNTTEQVVWLREEIARRGLSDELQVREADFREVDRQYDKVVSIGTLEHAGRDQLFEVVKAHADFLKPGGLGMLHYIGHVGHHNTELFIRKHVFPGGWIPSLSECIDAMERCGLEVVDIENLRRHYALTLDAWTERFERNWDQIHALDPKRFDERFRRIWRMYLVGCAEMFRSPHGYTHLFQIVYSKGNITKDNYPMSRGFVYA
jgi:cyclopropane-fatty-acyl-phospholipid synthase